MKSIKFTYITHAFLLVLISLLAVHPAHAQKEQEFRLRLSRDFGYGSLTGNQIQGTFSMHITGPENLTRVVFYLDDQVLEEVDEAPFTLRFITDNYDLGVHALQAIGFTSTGQELRSNIIRTEFVSADQGSGMAIKIVGLTFGVIIFGMVIAVIFGNVLGKGKKTKLPLGAERRYGAMGGAICPKCSRPFAVHVFSFNLMTARFDRCPYCGKWSFVRRVGLDELKRAEKAELEWATPEPELAANKTESDLLKELDNSRYQDL